MDTKQPHWTESSLVTLIRTMVDLSKLRYYELVGIPDDYFVTEHDIVFMIPVSTNRTSGGNIQYKFRALRLGDIRFALQFVRKENLLEQELDNNLVDELLTDAQYYDKHHKRVQYQVSPVEEDNWKTRTFPEEEDRLPMGWTPAPLPKYRQGDVVWFIYNNLVVHGIIVYATVNSEYRLTGSLHNVAYYLQSTSANQLASYPERKLFLSKQALLDSL